MSKSSYTPVADIKPVESPFRAYEEIKATFLTGKTRDIEYRRDQLYQLGRLLDENQDRICAAMASDLGRPRFETVGNELLPTINEIKGAISNLHSWAKPSRVSAPFPWNFTGPKIYKDPKGVALIIGTWNFPTTVSIAPLIGAIAAGCTAILKLAEQNPAYSAVIAELFPKYMDTTSYKIVLGAVDETTELLKHRFDHVMYTGSGRIGKIVAKAAAEHLSSVTLELGGKSPVVVFSDADLDVAAKRILWAKYTNSGQICIAPDYILVTPDVKPRLIEAFHRQWKIIAPKSVLDPDTEYCKIVTPAHYERLGKILDTTGGKVVLGGRRDDSAQKIETTILDMGSARGEDSVMQDEIFGPILPILTFKSKEDMVSYIQANDHPLALYVFTTKSSNIEWIRDRTQSGSLVANDLLIQGGAVPNLPFGGTGPSGTGNYHFKFSFDTFTHDRASLNVPGWMDLLLKSRYPPYTAANLKMMAMAVGGKLKKPSKPSPLFPFAKWFILAIAVAIGYQRKGELAAALHRISA